MFAPAVFAFVLALAGSAHAACSSATYSGPFTFTAPAGYTLYLAKDGANLCVRAQVTTTAGWVAFAKAATAGTMNGGEASFYQITATALTKDVVLGSQACPGCGGASSTLFNITEVNATQAGGVFTFEFARSDGINMAGDNNMLGAWRNAGTITQSHLPTNRGGFCVDLAGAAPRACDQVCPCPALTTGAAGTTTTTTTTSSGASTTTSGAASTTGKEDSGVASLVPAVASFAVAGVAATIF